ncbi:MAG: MoaD/ThiS family protein [Anaerolineales bacterium]|nr:MAG: MoaD/ThiS family protein [Anaerolineales bacterium]
MQIDVRLYGPLARYGGSDRNIHAKVVVDLAEGGTIAALLSALDLPTEERGITFINGDLSAMPGLQPDMDHGLQDGDRVAFFHTKSMWPFQYRHDVASLGEFKEALAEREDSGLRSRYD